MKGIVKGNTIILQEELPSHISDGQSVEVIIQPYQEGKYPFPTFPLSVKDEYIQRERIYEKE